MIVCPKSACGENLRHVESVSVILEDRDKDLELRSYLFFGFTSEKISV